MMDLEELISKTGDSELLDLKYDCKTNLLEFTLELDVIDKKISFTVFTKDIRFGSGIKKNKNCHLELIELSGKLETANGIYIPASDFGKLMIETKKGYNLVYGKRVIEASHLLVLNGSDLYFIAVIEKQDGVRFSYS